MGNRKIFTGPPIVTNMTQTPESPHMVIKSSSTYFRNIWLSIPSQLIHLDTSAPYSATSYLTPSPTPNTQHLSSPASKPSAITMYSQMMTFPSPTGVLKLANHSWKISQHPPLPHYESLVTAYPNCLFHT